jgi:glycosyltransferase involved in cell wall biosynthesis
MMITDSSKIFPKIAVLLSTYNGEEYLNELLDSIFNQEGVEITLFVRDDGSTDSTRDVIKRFANRSNVFFWAEEHVGTTKSFIKLIEKALRHANTYELFAFADQDDIWNTEKLASKSLLLGSERLPSLAFCGQEYFQDKDGYYPSRMKINLNIKIPFFRNAVRGCTMLLNRPLAERIARLDADKLVKHDYAAFICAQLYGKIYFTGEVGMRYRIHEGNETGVSNFKRKL